MLRAVCFIFAFLMPISTMAEVNVFERDIKVVCIPSLEFKATLYKIGMRQLLVNHIASGNAAFMIETWSDTKRERALTFITQKDANDVLYSCTIGVAGIPEMLRNPNSVILLPFGKQEAIGVED